MEIIVTKEEINIAIKMLEEGGESGYAFYYLYQTIKENLKQKYEI